MESFQHFIITRFNLTNETWNYDKNNVKVLDETWLNKRYKLFENYCFPSLLNQKEKEFIWLVYFDINTPENYKKENEKYARIFPNFTPVYKNNFKHFTSDLCSDIRKLIAEDTEYIITSRIDNDDAFHCDAIKIIQQQFNFQEKAIVDLTKGFCLQVKPSFKLSKSSLKLGPFVSLIERIDDGCFETIISRAHTDWNSIENIIEIKKQPLWIQIIHENNLLNVLNGNIVRKNINLEDFNFKDDTLIKYYLFADYYKTKIINILKRITKITLRK